MLIRTDYIQLCSCDLAKCQMLITLKTQPAAHFELSNSSCKQMNNCGHCCHLVMQKGKEFLQCQCQWDSAVDGQLSQHFNYAKPSSSPQLPLNVTLITQVRMMMIKRCVHWALDAIKSVFSIYYFVLSSLCLVLLDCSYHHIITLPTTLHILFQLLVTGCCYW